MHTFTVPSANAMEECKYQVYRTTCTTKEARFSIQEQSIKVSSCQKTLSRTRSISNVCFNPHKGYFPQDIEVKQLLHASSTWQMELSINPIFVLSIIYDPRRAQGICVPCVNALLAIKTEQIKTKMLRLLHRPANQFIKFVYQVVRGHY